MMRILPDCPNCQENDLWIQPVLDYVMLRCYDCGWGAELVERVPGQDLDAQIASAVAMAQEPSKEKPHF